MLRLPLPTPSSTTASAPSCSSVSVLSPWAAPACPRRPATWPSCAPRMLRMLPAQHAAVLTDPPAGSHRRPAARPACWECWREAAETPWTRLGRGCRWVLHMLLARCQSTTARGGLAPAHTPGQCRRAAGVLLRSVEPWIEPGVVQQLRLEPGEARSFELGSRRGLRVVNKLMWTGFGVRNGVRKRKEAF